MGYKSNKVYKESEKDDARLIIELDSKIKLSEFRGRQSEAALSLYRYYLKSGYWTKKQRNYVCFLLGKKKVKKSRLINRQYILYAISNGENIKLGFTSNLKSRLRSLQTSCDKQLKVLWEYPAGKNQGSAKAAEKRLHKYCSEYRVKGEWFDKKAMPKVRNFVIGKKQERDAKLDLFILNSGRI